MPAMFWWPHQTERWWSCVGSAGWPMRVGDRPEGATSGKKHGRALAAARLAAEAPGQTLQPTALVHEAYLRLVGTGPPRDWDGRGHFFAAAAEAMRRILVEAARRRNALKRGGGADHMPLDDSRI